MKAQIEKVLKEGKGHRFSREHNWKYVEIDRKDWNDETMGKSFEPLDEYYAVYRDLYRCSCGAEAIVRQVALI